MILNHKSEGERIEDICELVSLKVLVGRQLKLCDKIVLIECVFNYLLVESQGSS